MKIPAFVGRWQRIGRKTMADLPKLDVVIGNNFGHLPMFIGA